jgi:hypothetical protein
MFVATGAFMKTHPMILTKVGFQIIRRDIVALQNSLRTTAHATTQ